MKTVCEKTVCENFNYIEENPRSLKDLVDSLCTPDFGLEYAELAFLVQQLLDATQAIADCLVM